MATFLNCLWEKIRMVATASAFMLVGVGAMALPLGEREIAHFEREALRCARDLFQLPGRFEGNDYVVELGNQIVHEARIKRAKIIFFEMGQRDLMKLAANDFDFSHLKQSAGIEVEALIEAGAIQEIVSREMNRVPAGRRIANSINLTFLEGRVGVTGEIDLQKIPGNPFTFMPEQMSPFSATVAVRAEGSQIMLEIFEGQMNNQPLTPELKKMLLDWLNPLWDFTALPYSASLSYLQFTQAGVKFRGSLFR